VYGGEKGDAKHMASRQLLHSKSIEFELFGKKYSFESELLKDFLEFMAKLD
jgi:hypothetical protein